MYVLTTSLCTTSHPMFVRLAKQRLMHTKAQLWGGLQWKVDVDTLELEKPLPLNDIPEEWRLNPNEKTFNNMAK